jgi:hypothetical protein
MLSRVAAIECADANTNMRVNVVSPGGVKTPIWESVEFFGKLVAKHGSAHGAIAAMEGDTPSQRHSSPEEIARTILYLASDDSAHLTGIEVVIGRGHVGCDVADLSVQTVPVNVHPLRLDAESRAEIVADESLSPLVRSVRASSRSGVMHPRLPPVDG